MALGIRDKSAGESPLAEINMIPLIDVMLVLLVIFIVTAPLLTHVVRIELPRASATPIDSKPEAVALAIDAEGGTYWNGGRIAHAELLERLAAAARVSPQPELHLSVDKTTQYQVVAEVMAAAAKAGLNRIGFVSDPRDNVAQTSVDPASKR
jgi:biopolymer transport protein ExbD